MATYNPNLALASKSIEILSPIKYLSNDIRRVAVAGGDADLERASHYQTEVTEPDLTSTTVYHLLLDCDLDNPFNHTTPAQMAEAAEWYDICAAICAE